MNIHALLKEGTFDIMKTLGRFYLNNKRGLAFLASTLPQIKAGISRRDAHEQDGLHVPPFLIASIASQCNLFCSGCYARCGGACGGQSSRPDLTADEWRSVFDEASGLGVSFILLAGGEPLLRRDVIEAAASFTNMIFPVFTNGLLLDDEYLELFDKHRNMVPVLSIEGGKAETDARRGEGVHDRVSGVMERLMQRKMLFGVSVTVTAENIEIVMAEKFTDDLSQKGCGLIVFTEYVPTEADTEHLALSADGIGSMNTTVDSLRARLPDTIILSFPGDEAALGGCLASGRGFFHISPSGGAEPCPFSPHAKHNVRETPMAQILKSRYFAELRTLAAAEEDHSGGCVLFRKEKEVLAILGV